MKEQYSYSKIDMFDHCKYKYHLRYRKWIKEPQDDNAALNKGALVHLILERKINNETDLNDPQLTELLLKISKEDTMKILKSVKKFIQGEFFSALDLTQGVAEQMFYLDATLTPCMKDKAFISGKVDYRELKDDYVIIIDWKTGKKTLKEVQMYKKNDLQLDLYALWALQKFPDIHTAQTMLYFVESGFPDEKLVSQEDVPALKEKVMERINEIRAEKEFKRTLSPLCDYCGYFSEFCNNE